MHLSRKAKTTRLRQQDSKAKTLYGIIIELLMKCKSIDITLRREAVFYGHPVARSIKCRQHCIGSILEVTRMECMVRKVDDKIERRLIELLRIWLGEHVQPNKVVELIIRRMDGRCVDFQTNAIALSENVTSALQTPDMTSFVGEPRADVWPDSSDEEERANEELSEGEATVEVCAAISNEKLATMNMKTNKLTVNILLRALRSMWPSCECIPCTAYEEHSSKERLYVKIYERMYLQEAEDPFNSMAYCDTKK